MSDSDFEEDESYAKYKVPEDCSATLTRQARGKIYA